MALGGPEIILLVGLALLFFGPSKLPELARAFGQVTSQYRQGLNEAKKAFLEGSPVAVSAEDREIISAANKLNIPTQNRSIEEIASDLLNYQ